jgi:hypothetical protein
VASSGSVSNSTCDAAATAGVDGGTSSAAVSACGVLCCSVAEHVGAAVVLVMTVAREAVLANRRTEARFLQHEVRATACKCACFRQISILSIIRTLARLGVCCGNVLVHQGGACFALTPTGKMLMTKLAMAVLHCVHHFFSNARSLAIE